MAADMPYVGCVSGFFTVTNAEKNTTRAYKVVG